MRLSHSNARSSESRIFKSSLVTGIPGLSYAKQLRADLAVSTRESNFQAYEICHILFAYLHSRYAPIRGPVGRIVISIFAMSSRKSALSYVLAW